MNDDQRPDRSGDDARSDRSSAPDPSQDTWSAWLPQLDRPAEDATDHPAPPPAAAAPPHPLLPPPSAQPRLPHLPAPPPTTGGYGWGAPTTHDAPPRSHLLVAILVTFIGFMPFGIIAIIMAVSVNNRWSRGDRDGARRASRAAKAWAIAAMVVWLVLLLASSMFVGAFAFLHGLTQ